MSVDLMSCNVNTIERIMERLIRIEYGTVVRNDFQGYAGVQCRDDPVFGDNWNTVTVRVRSVKIKGTSKISGTPDKTMHYYCLVLQRYNQKWAGEPYTPRIGDLVAVLFIHNQKPLVLGTVVSNTQDPVCRAPFADKNSDTIDARYDYVKKWCQWKKPTFNENEEVTEHFPGEHPICEKIFHKNRDQIYVTDCKEGNKSACNRCTLLDHVKRYSNQWEKIYSCDTDSCDYEHPFLPHKQCYTRKRHEWHEPSGSYLVFQNSQYGDYDYGTGVVRLENAVGENNMKGHLNLDARGTIDVHTAHCNSGYATEATGTRMSVVALGDNTVTHSFEAIDFSKISYIRILKNGNILLSSLNGVSSILIDGNNEKVTISGITNVEIVASDEITCNAPITHVSGNMQIDGSCAHGSCSCQGTSSCKIDSSTGAALVKTPDDDEWKTLGESTPVTSISCYSSTKYCGCAASGNVYTCDGNTWSEFSTTPSMESSCCGCDGLYYAIDSLGNAHYWNAETESWVQIT